MEDREMFDRDIRESLKLEHLKMRASKLPKEAQDIVEGIEEFRADTRYHLETCEDAEYMRRHSDFPKIEELLMGMKNYEKGNRMFDLLEYMLDVVEETCIAPPLSERRGSIDDEFQEFLAEVMNFKEEDFYSLEEQSQRVYDYQERCWVEIPELEYRENIRKSLRLLSQFLPVRVNAAL